MSRIIPFPAAPVKPLVHPDTIRANEAAAARRREAPARELTPAQLAARLAYQEHKQQPTPNAHGVHVGDLFYDSWGYEQTNIDFYQVVALRGKQTAVLRRIAGDYGPEGYAMTGHTRPVRDAFRDAETIQRRTLSGYQGRAQVGSPRSGGGYLSPTGDDDQHAYSSYY